MNIVRLLGNKKVLSTIIGITLSIVAMQFALTPQHIHVIPDPRWSAEYHRSLTKRIERLSIRTIGASRLRDDLQKEYPCVKDLTLTYKSTREGTVKLSSWRPLVLLCSSLMGNKEYLVCETGQILERHYFTNEALQGIPTLVIEGSDFESKRQMPELIDMALKLKSDLFEKYSITWHAKTNITLHDKDKKVIITADILSIHDQDRYAYIEKIYSTEKQYRHGMKADIRLKDSLVCAPITRSKRP